MTRKEIEQMLSKLPRWENGKPPVLTPEQMKLREELSCREMINSILIYWGFEGLKVDGFCYKEYLKSYVDKLGPDTVKRLCDEQAEDFKNAVVYKNVDIDSEGVAYNSIVWADEMPNKSIKELLDDAKQRSSDEVFIGQDKADLEL